MRHTQSKFDNQLILTSVAEPSSEELETEISFSVVLFSPGWITSDNDKRLLIVLGPQGTNGKDTDRVRISSGSLDKSLNVL